MMEIQTTAILDTEIDQIDEDGPKAERPKTYCGSSDHHQNLEEAWSTSSCDVRRGSVDDRQGASQSRGNKRVIGHGATWPKPATPVPTRLSDDVNGVGAKDLPDVAAKPIKKWNSGANLKRNPAFYRAKTAEDQKVAQATRSKSLTHIECLEAETSDLAACTSSSSAAASVATSPRDRGKDAMDSGPLTFKGRHLSFHHHPPLQQHPSLPPLPLPLPFHFGDKLVVPSLEDQDKKVVRSHKCPQKISNPEFFTVSFDALDEPVEDILPVIRGHTLRDALQHLFDKRCLDFQGHVLVLEPQGTALSPQHELGKLGGCRIRVKAKEAVSGNGSHKVGKTISVSRDIQRKTSGSTRSKKGLLGVSSNEEANNGSLDTTPSSVQGSQEGSWKLGKTRSQGRLSGLFSTSSKDKEKMEALADLLNSYSQHGIPDLPGLLTFGHEDEDEQILRLEDTWTQIVDNATSLSERSQRQQSAIWELLTTEVAYIRKLRVITDLFIMCLCNLQSQRLLNEIDTEKLFNNVRDIYYSNRSFWKECLLRMLNESRATRKPLDPILMKDAFLNFDQGFHAYTKFCLEQANCLQYLKERHQENELFKAYIAWCETRKECNRLRLLDLLVKPMQRLTKYPLVLKGIHRTTDNEDDRQVLLEMWKHADRFVLKVNSVVGQSQEQKQMLAISARIDSYEAVDTKDDEVERVLRQHMELNLECPMPGCNPQQSRHLFMEGDVRLKDSTTGKMDVRCFLFTDMLLVCKPLAKKCGDRVKVIRQPYVIDRVIVHELRDSCGLALVYLNEYHVATAAFTLHCPDTRQARNWADAMRKARDVYRDAKMASVERTDFLTVEGEDDLDSPG